MHKMGMFYITFITIKWVCLIIKHYVSRILNVSSKIASILEKGEKSGDSTNTRLCWLWGGMKLYILLKRIKHIMDDSSYEGSRLVRKILVKWTRHSSLVWARSNLLIFGNICWNMNNSKYRYCNLLDSVDIKEEVQTSVTMPTFRAPMNSCT